MLSLWSEETKYQRWFDVEWAVCYAMEEFFPNLIPAGTSSLLKSRWEANSLSVQEILLIEQQTQHDVIAFLTYLERNLGKETRFFHLGLTSSDIVDTALAMQLRDATNLIIAGIEHRLLPVLQEKCEKYRNTLLIGRSHGIHAEPITAGLVFASFYAEINRNLKRLQAACKEISVGKISGAVGVYGSFSLSPNLESNVLSHLGLSPETVSTQIVARDRHAELFLSLSLLAAAIERIALTIRHWQRTEVKEAEEAFQKKQKGSSAMPHKKNPILSENLCGLSRIVRAQASSALENIALWHERDISHSSVERVIAPDITSLVDFMVQRASGLVERLELHEQKMLNNLELTKGLYASEKVLLSLIQKGLARQEAYEIVQGHALNQGEKSAGNFQESLAADPIIQKYLSLSELQSCFEHKEHLRHIDEIYNRTFAG